MSSWNSLRRTGVAVVAADLGGGEDAPDVVGRVGALVGAQRRGVLVHIDLRGRRVVVGDAGPPDRRRASKVSVRPNT